MGQKRQWMVERALNAPHLEQVLNDLEGRGWTIFEVMPTKDGAGTLQHYEVAAYKGPSLDLVP